jgi:hypothetical protein
MVGSAFCTINSIQKWPFDQIEDQSAFSHSAVPHYDSPCVTRNQGINRKALQAR